MACCWSLLCTGAVGHEGNTGCLLFVWCAACRYYTANNGQQPGCLLVYRDGVSDSELQRVRQDEVRAVIEVRTRSCAATNPTKACKALARRWCRPF